MNEDIEFLEEVQEEQNNISEFVDDVIWHIQILESYKFMSDNQAEIQQIDKQISELESAIRNVQNGDML